MRITKLGWFLIVLLAATAILALFAPTAGLVAAIVLAVVVLAVLSDGFLGEGSQGAVHDAWAHVESERKRDSLRR
jgi:hypothetical protein